MKEQKYMYLFWDERARDEDGLEKATMFFMNEDLVELKKEIKESELCGFVWKDKIVGENNLETDCLLYYVENGLIKGE